MKKVKQTFDADMSKTALGNLKNFTAEAKLKQAAITFMTTHLATKEERMQLKQSFQQMDVNGDGKIELDEFIDAYKKSYPELDAATVEVKAREFFKRADADGNGSIDFSEWSAATINKTNLLNERNLKECFKMFDRDGGGSISAQEVGEILGGSLSKDNKVWK